MVQVNPIQAQKFLGGMNYPAGKGEIFKNAERQYDGPNATFHEISEAQ